MIPFLIAILRSESLRYSKGSIFEIESLKIVEKMYSILAPPTSSSRLSIDLPSINYPYDLTNL